MCRDGYTAPCAEKGCEGVTHCRREMYCDEHQLDLWGDDDEV